MKRSRERRLPAVPVAPAVGLPTPLLPQRAFVVHLREGMPSGAARAGMAGRVEHVVSGRTAEFASLAELSQLMAGMVATGSAARVRKVGG